MSLSTLLQKKSKDNSLELEVRFGKVDIRSFYSVVDFFSSKKLEKLVSTDISTIYENNIRSIRQGKVETFERKKVLDYFVQDGAKYILNSEEIIPSMIKANKVMTRKRFRTSFQDEDIIRIDCTRIVSNDELTFEIEIEVLQVNAKTKAKLDLALKVITSMLPCTDRILGSFQHLTKEKRRRFYGVLPRTLTTVPRFEEDPHMLTYKQDGERVLLYKHDNSIYECTRTSNFYRVTNKTVMSDLAPLPNGTIIDCEKMDADRYIFFDVLYLNYKDLTRLDTNTRIQALDNYQLTTLRKQKFFQVNDQKQYQEHIANMQTTPEIEGIILCRKAAKYFAPNTFIKVKSINTIDLLIKKKPTLTIDHTRWSCYMKGNNQLELLTSIEVVDTIDSQFEDHSVVEFEVLQQSYLRPLKQRRDKVIPNFTDTVSDIYKKEEEDEIVYHNDINYQLSALMLWPSYLMIRNK